MSYDEFKKTVMEKLREFYGDDAEITVETVKKLNGTGYEGISVRKDNQKKSAVPMIAIDDFYREYSNGEIELDDCIGKIIDLQDQYAEFAPIEKTVEELLDWNRIKSRVFPVLISTSENEDLLNKLVSTDFLDLSVIYVVRIMELKHCAGHVKITKSQLKMWNIDKEELHAQALKNMAEDGYGFVDMKKVLSEIIYGEPFPTEEVESLDDGGMYILSNADKNYGAAGILDGDMLSQYLKNDSYYILPSSIHETIFVRKAEDFDINALKDIIKEVNETKVEIADQLSDHVYVYDGVTHKVKLCA